uniref:Aldo/keto reductase n=1 Tax=Phenylobacterium glaciei TaxID=2803784 RepID=A0A974S867_9CAUL|nr:aldo/keto reductase [Phenylobacterium glaciei]
MKAARARVEAAIAAGLTFLDTADIYGPDNDEPFGAAEALFGLVLKEAPQLRDQIVLASKGGIVMGTPYDSSAAYLESAVEASLSRMGVEKIDLYQIHRPDHLAHPAEVAQVLTRLRSAGKIGEVGLSNHTAAQVSALQAHLAFPIACVQIEFSPLVVGPLYDGTLDQALETGMGVMAWSPLAQGRLADGPSTDERVIAVRAELDKAAAAHGVSAPWRPMPGSWLIPPSPSPSSARSSPTASRKPPRPSTSS